MKATTLKTTTPPTDAATDATREILYPFTYLVAVVVSEDVVVVVASTDEVAVVVFADEDISPDIVGAVEVVSVNTVVAIVLVVVVGAVVSK